MHVLLSLGPQSGGWGNHHSHLDPSCGAPALGLSFPSIPVGSAHRSFVEKQQRLAKAGQASPNLQTSGKTLMCPWRPLTIHVDPQPLTEGPTTFNRWL